MANRWRKNGHSDRFIFLGSKNTADGDCSHEIKRCLLLGRKAMTNLDSESKSWDVTLMTKSPYSQSVSSSHVWMWELDHKGGWAPKNWCIWTAVLENALESPLDCKEIKPVNAKGNQSWMFTGRTDAETEAPILWPPDGKSQLTGIDSDAGKDRRQEEKGTTENDTVGWHHQLKELAQTHFHRVSDAIQPSHPLLSPFPFAFSLSQHQGLFKWVSYSQ